MISTVPIKMRRSHADSLQECRNLIDILVKRTEALYRECRNDRDKTAQLRGMGTALANLTYLINELDNESLFLDVPLFSRQVNGIARRSARPGDPDRTGET